MQFSMVDVCDDSHKASSCIAGGIAEELAASLKGGCPAFFKETDRVFYQASGLLQRAEGVTSTSERLSLTKEALHLMMQVRPISSKLEVYPPEALLPSQHPLRARALS